jgi:hypothetical protein
VTYKCDLVYPFSDLSKLKKNTARITQSIMYNFTLRTISFHTDTEILRILALQTLFSCLILKFNCFFENCKKEELLFSFKALFYILSFLNSFTDYKNINLFFSKKTKPTHKSTLKFHYHEILLPLKKE